MENIRLLQEHPTKRQQVTTSAPVTFTAQGVDSSNNTSTTPLAGGATFTGVAEENAFPDVMVSCQTDADGTLYFDFSVDGVNWSTFPVGGFTVSAGSHEFHTAVKGPRPFRVRLVNGSGAQGYLRLYTYYGQFRQGNLPLGATIGGDADALVVRSVPASLDLAFGRFGGLLEDTKFGYVKGVDAADSAKDVWDWASDDLSGADTKVFPGSAATLYFASDDSADTNLEFTFDYIDAAGAVQSVVASTDASDGTTPVSLGVSGLDVNRVRLTGGDQAHVGNIYVQQGNGFTSGEPDVASAVLAFIRAGHGQTQQTQLTTPVGGLVRIKRIIVTVARSSGAAGRAEIQLKAKPLGGSWITKREWFLQTGTFVKDVAGLVFDGGVVLRMVLGDVSDTDTNVTAEYVYEYAET